MRAVLVVVHKKPDNDLKAGDAEAPGDEIFHGISSLSSMNLILLVRNERSMLVAVLHLRAIGQYCFTTCLGYKATPGVVSNKVCTVRVKGARSESRRRETDASVGILAWPV